MADKKKGKKKGAKKIARAKAGALNCHILKKGGGLVLKCPGVKGIKMAAGFVGVKFAPKGVAKAAKAAPATGTVVATGSGKAATVNAPHGPWQQIDYKTIKVGASNYPFAS